jgi:hypothetical protein
VCVEIGLKSSEGYFVRIARSARVDLPRSAPVSPGEVEWMSVRSATGDIESSHTSPAPAADAPSTVGSAPAADAWRPEHGAADAPPNVVGGQAANGTRVTAWHEVLPGAWGEVRRTHQWVGEVEHTSWEAGPFSHPVEVPQLEVLESHGGAATVEQSGPTTRVVAEPWEVVIRGIGGHVQRRVLARWEVVHAAAPQPDPESMAISGEAVAIGGSDSVARLGRGSELRLAGASEEFMVGASELRYRGASERLYLGASERRWLGGSERVAARGAAWQFAGASERVPAGASEYRLGGASEMARSARESWQIFAEAGARLIGEPPAPSVTPPAAAPVGASERRLAGSVSAPADATAPGDATLPPAPPRW